MIHAARPTVSPVANIVFTLFVLIAFEEWGRTDDMCENNYSTLRDWVGRVDQYQNYYAVRMQQQGLFLVFFFFDYIAKLDKLLDLVQSF